MPQKPHLISWSSALTLSVQVFLMAACSKGNFESLTKAIRASDKATVSNFLRDGGDPNLTGKFKKNPHTTCSLLHFAAAQGEYDIVSLLLEHGADPNLTTPRDGCTSIAYMLVHSNVTTPKRLEVFDLLLRRTSVDVTDIYGRNLFLIAARHGSVEEIRRSAQVSDDLFAVDSSGNCALTEAVLSKNQTTQRLEELYSLGLKAQMNLENSYGETALDKAREFRNEEAVKFLQEE